MTSANHIKIKGIPLEADIVNLHKMLVSNEKFMLAVTASWCGHCVRLNQQHWPHFIASPAAQNARIVELDYTAYKEIVKNDKLQNCLFRKLLNESVNAFPYIALVQNKPDNVSVRMYDGHFPMDASSLHRFISI